MQVAWLDPSPRKSIIAVLKIGVQEFRCTRNSPYKRPTKKHGAGVMGEGVLRFQTWTRGSKVISFIPSPDLELERVPAKLGAPRSAAACGHFAILP